MPEKLLMKGNEALAESAIRAGCKYFFGYPITPQTEIAAYMAKRLPEVDGVYLQAESEIAAVNMVFGAAATGKRAMTSSSSPGISLKTEGISYMAGSDIPALIVNVQRAGPGLGGIQPCQADYWQATKAMGHGDFQILVFAPSDVQEMADLVSKAFDMAEKYRIPAMILADGVLGQMMEPVKFNYDNCISLEKPWALTGHRNKRKHNVVNSLYLEPDKLENIIKKRFQKYEIIKNSEQMAQEYLVSDADVVLVAYGACSRIAKSSVDMARKEGIKAGLIRPITLWPFPEYYIKKCTKKAKKFLCVEMSMGQMVDDVRLAVNGKREVYFFGRTGGIVPTPLEILNEIKKLIVGENE